MKHQSYFPGHANSMLHALIEKRNEKFKCNDFETKFKSMKSLEDFLDERCPGRKNKKKVLELTDNFNTSPSHPAASPSRPEQNVSSGLHEASPFAPNTKEAEGSDAGSEGGEGSVANLNDLDDDTQLYSDSIPPEPVGNNGGISIEVYYCQSHWKHLLHSDQVHSVRLGEQMISETF